MQFYFLHAFHFKKCAIMPVTIHWISLYWKGLVWYFICSAKCKCPLQIHTCCSWSLFWWESASALGKACMSIIVFWLNLNPDADKTGWQRLLINLSKAGFWKGFTLRKTGHCGQQSLLPLQFVHWSIRCLPAVCSWDIWDLRSHCKVVF